MKIAIGSDHGGFALKEAVRKHLEEKGSSGSIELYALQIQCISFRYRSKELNVILWPDYASAQFLTVYRGFLL